MNPIKPDSTDGQYWIPTKEAFAELCRIAQASLRSEIAPTPTDGSRLRDKAPLPVEVLADAHVDPLPLEQGRTRPAQAVRSAVAVAPDALSLLIDAKSGITALMELAGPTVWAWPLVAQLEVGIAALRSSVSSSAALISADDLIEACAKAAERVPSGGDNYWQTHGINYGHKKQMVEAVRGLKGKFALSASAPTAIDGATVADEKRIVPYFPTWQMKEAGGEAYLKSREMEGQKTGLTAMHMAEGIYAEMLRAAPGAPSYGPDEANPADRNTRP